MLLLDPKLQGFPLWRVNDHKGNNQHLPPMEHWKARLALAFHLFRLFLWLLIICMMNTRLRLCWKWRMDVRHLDNRLLEKSEEAVESSALLLKEQRNAEPDVSWTFCLGWVGCRITQSERETRHVRNQYKAFSSASVRHWVYLCTKFKLHKLERWMAGSRKVPACDYFASVWEWRNKLWMKRASSLWTFRRTNKQRKWADQWLSEEKLKVCVCTPAKPFNSFQTKSLPTDFSKTCSKRNVHLFFLFCLVQRDF